MKKQALRKLYKQKRTNLSGDKIKSFQENIFQQILKIDFSSEKNIHIFLPIEKQKEINTYPIIEFLQKKDKQIIISKSDFKTNTLTHFIFDCNTVLKTNEWGIPEPINATQIDVKQIDLVFVPLLISDKKNYRVGYGKGFYDRFLSECKPLIKTIGLNFFKPITRIEDINGFDVPLDLILYPK